VYEEGGSWLRSINSYKTIVSLGNGQGETHTNLIACIPWRLSVNLRRKTGDLRDLLENKWTGTGESTHELTPWFARTTYLEEAWREIRGDMSISLTFEAFGDARMRGIFTCGAYNFRLAWIGDFFGVMTYPSFAAVPWFWHLGCNRFFNLLGFRLGLRWGWRRLWWVDWEYTNASAILYFACVVKRRILPIVVITLPRDAVFLRRQKPGSPVKQNLGVGNKKKQIEKR